MRFSSNTLTVILLVTLSSTANESSQEPCNTKYYNEIIKIDSTAISDMEKEYLRVHKKMCKEYSDVKDSVQRFNRTEVATSTLAITAILVIFTGLLLIRGTSGGP